MSIICDFDDYLPANRTAIPVNGNRFENIGAIHGMFGNGARIVGSNTFPVADWGGLRMDDVTIPMDGTKVIMSSIIRIPAGGIGASGFCIGGVGMGNAGATVMSAGLGGCVIIDGRDASGTSAAYQIRDGSISNSVYMAVSTTGQIMENVYYRCEMEIQTTAMSADYTILARWYNHTTNTLLHSASYTRLKPGATQNPMFVTYRGILVDSLQVQIGTEAYVSNMPVRSWNGTAWVRKPLAVKKRTASAWAQAYPKVVDAKTSALIW